MQRNEEKLPSSEEDEDNGAIEGTTTSTNGTDCTATTIAMSSSSITNQTMGRHHSAPASSSTYYTPAATTNSFGMIATTNHSSTSSSNGTGTCTTTTTTNTTKTSKTSCTTTRTRIPATLQAVFLASNRGNDVYVPPPDMAASKVYFRNWLFQVKRTPNVNGSSTGSSSNSNSSSCNGAFGCSNGVDSKMHLQQQQQRIRCSRSRSCSSNSSSSSGDNRMSLFGRIRRVSSMKPLQGTSSFKSHKNVNNKPNKKKNQQLQRENENGGTVECCRAVKSTTTPSQSGDGNGVVPISEITATATTTTTNSSPKKKKPQVNLSPQQYLDSMIRSRGYSTLRYKTLESGYYSKPTEYQQACYDSYLIRVAKTGNDIELNNMLQCGISPNPCNAYGESLLHTICRCGDAQLLRTMIQYGSDVAVSDDYGRTPLHDACWSAKSNIFDVIEIILNQEHGKYMFFMADCRSSLPLQYVSRDYWGNWIEWLESKKDIYWPRRNRVNDGEAVPPPLTLVLPNTRSTPIPNNALPLELASLVVSGRMTPKEVELVRDDIVVIRKTEQQHQQCHLQHQEELVELVSDDDDDDSDEEDDDIDEEDEEDSDDDDDDQSDNDELFDENEMADLLQYAHHKQRTTATSTCTVEVSKM